MIPSLHDILNGQFASRACAEILADEMQHADPQAAAVLREFSEELKKVCDRYLPLLPSNKDIGSLLGNRYRVSEGLKAFDEMVGHFRKTYLGDRQ